MRWHYRDVTQFETRREAYERAVADAIRHLISTDPKITPKWGKQACALSDAEIVAIVACEPVARAQGLVGVSAALANQEISVPWYVLKTILAYTASGGTKLPPRDMTESPVSAVLAEIRRIAARPVAELVGA
jgi:hypothetical protein